MLLNNNLFNVDAILIELASTPKGNKSTLEILQTKLKAHYFDKDISNEEALNELKNRAFNVFPRLQYVLQQIFEGQSHIEIPETSHDWEPTVSFQDINNKYGYFNADLSPLFQQLAVACKKMTTLIEGQAHDDEMAYKLMALFYDPKKDLNENFKLISQKFDKLITTKQDKNIATPYHDAFVTTLNDFPKLQDIKNFDSWISFIIKEGFKSLDIFAKCARTSPAFKTIKEAQDFFLKETYPRANENPTLARLCKNMLISNSGFEAGLKEVNSGWPKKTSDNLPIVDIQDTTGQYFWVKLPPQDMRALYLGNLIPGCCQFINGNSSQCVKDGIRLSDNGFYVLLKSKKTQANPNRIKDDQINDKDYDIVAQSYAWKTRNGNLCLDSIEWDRARLSTGVIQDLMTKFSELVFVEYPNIKYINVGKGGQTPKELFMQDASIPETMQQGEQYGDCVQQLKISSNISNDAFNKLKEDLRHFQKQIQDTVLYLAPYFEDIENVPARLLSTIDELPQIFSKINLPPTISTDDFKKISYDEYQTMEPSEQSSITTVCKIFNSQNEEDLKKWLDTIPVDELSYIYLMKNNFSLEFKIDVLQRLSPKYRTAALNQLDSAMKSIMTQSLEFPGLLEIILNLFEGNQILDEIKATLKDNVSNPESLKMILKLIPKEKLLDTLKEKNEYGYSRFGTAMNPKCLITMLDLLPEQQLLEALKERDVTGELILMKVPFNPQYLRIMLGPNPSIESLDTLKEKVEYGQSIFAYSASNPETLQMILDLYPDDESRLNAIQEQKNITGDSILSLATANPSCLEMILDLYPDDESRLKAIQEQKNKNGDSILSLATASPSCLEMILDLYPDDESRFKAIQGQKNRYGDSILSLATANPSCLKMILDLYPTNELRLKAIQEQKNITGDSILSLATANPSCLKMILDLYPTNELRLKAIQEQKNKNGDSILWLATKNPDSLRMVLEVIPEGQRLTMIKDKHNRKSVLLDACSNPESLRIILDLLSAEQCLDILKEKDVKGESILFKVVTKRSSLPLILSKLPISIAYVIDYCAKSLEAKDFEKPIFSMLKFINDLKTIVPAEVSERFIHAVITNNGIKQAVNDLLIPQSSNSFFKTSTNDIKKCINQLDIYWLSRIPRFENGNPIIEDPVHKKNF